MELFSQGKHKNLPALCLFKLNRKKKIRTKIKNDKLYRK